MTKNFMSNAPVSVIETRWWEKGNHSVKPIFEAVAALNYGNPSAIYYDMFSEKNSLASTLEMRCKDKTTKVLYLATHGDASSTFIGKDEANEISRTEFKNLLQNANSKSQLDGLFLGTCYTATNKTIEFVMDKGSTKLNWVAGYTENVDWVEGTAIDMVFFHHLTREYIRNSSRKRGKWSAVEIAKFAATEVMKLIPAAHSKYGFNIYYLDDKNVTSMFAGK
jgi:hypothetical protein